MSAPRREPPSAVRHAQTLASHPETSAFVAANAGSGKTHVLVNRVIRLLLNGVPPGKILCITFTKAAAANMAERVFLKLGHWVRLSDDELDREIRDIGEVKPTTVTRDHARKLFALALDTPGGLKVQTIHALCTRLLQQFPFEAKVPAHFAVLDERDQNDMMDRANVSVLLEAARAPDSETGRALDAAMTMAADTTFQEVVRNTCLTNRHFVAWADSAGNTEAALIQIAHVLGIEPKERAEDVANEIVNGSHLPLSEWLAAAIIFDTGSSNDKKQAARLREAVGLNGENQITEYLQVFFNKEMEKRDLLATKKISDPKPDFNALLYKEQTRIEQLLNKRNAITQRDRTAALFVIARAVFDNYRREKRERGLLDYDDLIDKTLDLLSDGASGWVHFKLDRGIDHVLIDEAQDTSPKQWDIVGHLVEEFWSGKGARDGVKRTIFAVGDEKQSIFSFQGAAPRELDVRRRIFETKFREARLAFESVSFKHSFRSGKAILQAVDQVFFEPNIYSSIHAPTNLNPLHEALDDATPARIDLWQLEEASETEDEGGWKAPLDARSESSPEARLAQRVRVEIDAMIRNETMTGIGENRRPISYGDMLILVRRRGAAFDAVIQALKRAGIPVAGADRLKLTEHIAVIDLMHLADALLLREDDLALAVALKSPLFGLDDDDLLILAPERSGSLRAALSDHAHRNKKLKIALDRLETYEQRFKRETPFAFFAWVLGGDKGRARILKRLGAEANDALDEFLELALSYERKAPASLQGFMAWLRAAETQVKRDMEIARDEVRVMTVHGAKGLEAPAVFLIDTTTSPKDTLRQDLITLPHGNAKPHATNIVVWAGKKEFDTQGVATARETAKTETEDEYRRLLYVAMTRAADRLIVGGVLPGNRNKLREFSWYDLIAKGLDTSGLQKAEIETSHGAVARYTRADDIEPEASTVSVKSQTPHEALPDWLLAPATKKSTDSVLLRPSDPSDEDGPVIMTRETEARRKEALRRGTLAHRLLQSLPDILVEHRAEAAKNFLTRNAGDWSEGERDKLSKEILTLISNEIFSPLFAPGSRAEVSIAGYVEQRGKRAVVSGQIDRLVVTPKDVLILDYKTNHAPPLRAEDVPQSYVRQLALYRDVLRRLYPDRSVRCALLWTETATLMEIPAAALDAELQRLLA